MRRATADDGPCLAAIDRASWSPASDPGELWDATRPFFGAPTGARPDEVLVAVLDAEPVGFIKVHDDADDERALYIGGLAVSPHHRRQGVARALLDAALADALARGRVRVWLKALGSNTAAIALYQARHFVIRDRLELVDARGQRREDLRLEWQATRAVGRAK